MPTVQGVKSTIGPGSVASKVFGKSGPEAVNRLLTFHVPLESSTYLANSCH